MVREMVVMLVNLSYCKLSKYIKFSSPVLCVNKILISSEVQMLGQAH